MKSRQHSTPRGRSFQFFEPPSNQASTSPYLAAISLLGLLPLSLATARPALTQEIGQTLPPPPDVQVVDPTVAPSSDLPFIPIDKTFQAPAASPGVQERSAAGYRVIVNGNSTMLLQQVQRVEPKAFVSDYKGRKVIQTGVFSEQANAQQQVAMLQSQGIQAEVLSSATSNPIQSSAYLVVVPGRRENLANIRAQIIQLGADRQAVIEKMAPLGPHVEVGPFSDRQTAEEWNQLLRKSGGLDARVYYTR
jgi:cell division septation protein DedD